MSIPTGIVVTDITLAVVKDYMKIDYVDDDILLETIMAGANSYIQNYLNRKFIDFEEIPKEFTIAFLALTSHWYEKREIQADKAGKELNYIFAELLEPHRYNIGESIEVIL